MFSSLAVNQSLKEKGIMQATTQQTEDLFDSIATVPTVYPTPGIDIVGASDAKEISPATLSTILDAKEKLGLGDEVSLEEMVEVTKTPIKPLTKKQQKQQKYMMKNMQSHIRSYQRKSQAQHVMSKLFNHSIRTPEQLRQVHATRNAREELTSLLGQRQADAFFAAGPDVKCHDFFPKVTVDANPKLMTDIQGQSRTLAQVYEYYIYKHVMLLAAKDETPVETPLDTEVNWAGVEVPEYRAFDKPREPEWDPKELDFPIGEPIKLTENQIDQFSHNIRVQHALEGRDVPAAVEEHLQELKENSAL